MIEPRGRIAVTPAARVAAAAVMLVLLAMVSVLAARGGPDWSLAGSSVEALVVEVAGAVALVGAGIVVYLRGPDTRSGWLLALAGLLRLVAEWNNPDGAPAAVVFTLGLALAAAATAPLAHALLVHGVGRLHGLASRLAAITAYTGTVLLLGVAPTLVSDPRVEGCPACPANLLHVTTDTDLAASFYRWGLALTLSAVTVVTVMALVRLAFWSSARRRLAAPVVIPGCVVLVLIGADVRHSWHRGFMSNDPVDRRLWLLQAVAIWLVVGGVIWQRLQARRVRAALARIVVELGDSPRPGGLREALADVLRDPDLELFHAHRAGWTDGQGQTWRRPGKQEPGTVGVATTELIRDGRVVAALVHRRGLLDDPALVRELDRTARLALEHDRLHAELRAELAQLRASRAEIVAVADAERRRLERDLHDGAQQALAGLAMTLGLARANTTDRVRAERLEATQDAVRAALANLRVLAHRLHPSALIDGGLAAALDVLAEWAPEVEMAEVSPERFDPAVESAAYFVVAFLARTVSGPIVVGARGAGDTLLLEVRVAEPPGSLVELEDRVRALDGRLVVERAADAGTVVRAEFPCES